MPTRRRAAACKPPTRLPPNASGNRLLDALPSDEYQRLLPSLSIVSLKFRKVLHAAGEPVEHVYFPAGGVCSIVAAMEDGRMVEVAIIGNEGMTGATSVLGGGIEPGEIIVHVPGPHAYMMSADRFTEEIDRRGALYQITRRYFQALVASVMQTAACNGLHTAHQRCARWLLQACDRAGRDRFELTQELLAVMLGVRRATITLIANDLQRAGLIEFERRRITIVSRPGLEEMTCECYRVIRRQYERLTKAERPAATGPTRRG